MTTPQDLKNSNLKKENEKLLLVLDGVLTPIVYVNSNLQYVFINRAYLDWYSLEREDIEGRFIREILAADVYERALQNYRTVLDGQPVYFENKTTRNGEEKYVSVRLMPHFVDNRVIGFFSTIMDITELKMAEMKNQELIQELSKSLAEVKRLSGMLPICSSCKKIKGNDGYWQNIDKFIEDRSDARFSHSICPECSTKLYGNEDWYKTHQQTSKDDT